MMKDIFESAGILILLDFSMASASHTGFYQHTSNTSSESRSFRKSPLSWLFGVRKPIIDGALDGPASHL
jgi:hypothetical protein